MLPSAVHRLLPLPAAGNFNDGEDLESWEERRQRNLAKGINGNGQGTPLAIAAQQLLPTPQVADVTGGHRSRSGDRSDEPLLPAVAEQIGGELDWGPYAVAVTRWAQVTGIEPPSPVEPGRNGMRLSPAFVEWMQGLAPGWVTDVPGLSRNAKLKALGNGVVPLQALLALAIMRSRIRALRRVSPLWLIP